MDKKMNFKYFYGTEADQFSFYRIPKALFTNDYFKDLSSDAKILYGLMLDRMSLSIKNQWFDEENRAYIYFSIEDIMELLNCGRNKAVKSLQELDDEKGIGLIEKRRQGFGKVSEIAHNPYHLISYLTAKYGDWKFEDIKDELQDLFEAQYHLNTEGKTETVTETKTVRVGESLGNVVTSGYCNCSICYVMYYNSLNDQKQLSGYRPMQRGVR